MRNELNTNNSKKLIIGISIIFCAVILIIGGTTAYFTQSDSESTGNIVSTDKVTLDYQDDDSFMLGDLIPINECDLDNAYNNKCKDYSGYNVCSIYQFTITNTGNVTQDIIINLHPKVNGFTNLKFNLIDITNNDTIIKNKQLILNSEEPITLKNDLRLDTNNNKSNTYELVFYIKNDPNNDQSHLDAGVRFGANIEVNSVTTGFHVIKDLGDPGCWKADENDPTIISEFIGYKDNNGNQKFDETDELKQECELYFKKDKDNYYIVNIPSEYAGYNFTKIGNFLLLGVNLDEDGNPSAPNEYNKIKSITIEDEFTTIGELSDDVISPSFAFIGSGIEDPNYKLEVKLPNDLTIIGNNSFFNTSLTSITIPKKVEVIGYNAFSDSNLISLDFEGTDDNTSKLKEIRDFAFGTHNLVSLKIPYSVTLIGDSAFDGNSDNPTLQTLIFAGSLTERIEEGEDKNLLTIGSFAFSQHNLTYLGTNDDDWLKLPARVDSIGSSVFSGNTGNGKDLKFIRYMGSREKLDTFGTDWYKSGITVKAYGE